MQTLVMIPGLGSDGAVWRRTVAALGGDVACVIGDTLSGASLPKMAERILAQATPRFALARVSMGGMVALQVLKLAPERVTRLALVDTNARPDTLAQKAYRRAGRSDRFRRDDGARQLGKAEGPMTAAHHKPWESQLKG